MHVDAITTIGEQSAIAVPRAVLGVLFIVKSSLPLLTHISLAARTP
jgi:hypothetical protein